METLAGIVRKRREELGLSLREVEEKAGISNAYISQLENEKILCPSPSVLKKMADLYGLSYNRLMILAGHPAVPPDGQANEPRGLGYILDKSRGDNVNSFADYLEGIKNVILTAIRKHRMERELVGNVYEDIERSKIQHIPKRRGEERKRELPGGGIEVTLAPLILEDVNPIQIRATWKIDPLEWFKNRESFYVDPYLDEIGLRIALLETSAVITGLAKEAEEFHAHEPMLTRSDIAEAARWIGSNKHVADTLVVDPEQEMKLIMRKEIIPIWSLLPTKPDGDNQHLCGIIDGLKVYWTPKMSGNMALLYEKKETYFAKTPMRIFFDDPAHPSKMIIEEDCVAWAMDSKAIANISLNAGS